MNNILTDYANAAETILESHTPADPGTLAQALKAVVNQHGPNIYRTPEQLCAALTQIKLEPVLIKQVELAVCGSSVTRYLEHLNNGLSGIDINNIILTMEASGLAPKTARQLTADILYSLNVPQTAEDLTDAPADQCASLYIPPKFYQETLQELTAIVNEGKVLDGDQFTQLNRFIEAGIPEACTLMGRLMLQGQGLPKNEEQALSYLEIAASHGDSEANGLLGDYYYTRSNKKAHKLYCRPGAMALNEKRWSNFRNMETTKRFCRSQFIFLGILLLVIEVFMFALQASPISGGHLLAAILLSVVNLLVAGAVCFLHMRDPYQDLRFFSLPFLVTFFIYALILV